MCGRFYIADEAEDELLHHLISELNRKQGSQAVTKGEVRPADHAMIIANSRQLTPSLFTMQWGYTLDTGARLINARSETAEEKRMFFDGFTRRRCLVPASGYYEWRKIGRERQQYAIKPQRTSHCFFAGIYRFEQEKPVFTILTREAAEGIRHIHDRMPVMLDDASARQWLNMHEPAGSILKNAVLDTDIRLVAGTEPMFDPGQAGFAVIREE